jgi:hypothetical protein
VMKKHLWFSLIFLSPSTVVCFHGFLE